MVEITTSFAKELRPTKIILENKSFYDEKIAIEVRLISDQIVVFVDDNLKEHSYQNIIRMLSPALIISVTCLEKNKSREEKHRIEDLLLKANIKKSCSFVCIGGGMLCDLIGFIAATYFRGVALVLVPTTLLCMVDACIGGKTAINAFGVKNCIGTIYPANLIVIDTGFLDSLPLGQFISGLAEVIKYSLIAKRPSLSFLEKNKKQIFEKDPQAIHTIIFESIKTKSSIVRVDPYDKGKRSCLNFGHTLGHAIESFYNYNYSHGRAVASGICLESVICMMKGFLSKKDVHRIVRTIIEYKLDISFISDLSFDMLESFLVKDKKNSQNSIRISPISAIGRAGVNGKFLCDTSKEEISEAIHFLSEYMETYNDNT